MELRWERPEMMECMSDSATRAEEPGDSDNTVSKEDALCPFLVLDVLRDGMPHRYEQVIDELAAVAAVSKKAEDNLYRTISLLMSYDPPLIVEETRGSVKHLIITDPGKAQLQHVKSEHPGFTEYIIHGFEAFFNEYHREDLLKVVREGRGHISIHLLDVEWFRLQMGEEMLGNPRHMLALAEEAITRLVHPDEPVNVHVTYPCPPFLYFYELDQRRKQKEHDDEVSLNEEDKDNKEDDAEEVT